MAPRLTNPPVVLPRAVEPDRYAGIRWVGIVAGFAFSGVSWFLLLFSLWFLQGPWSGLAMFVLLGLVAGAAAIYLYGRVPSPPCPAWVRVIVGVSSHVVALVLITALVVAG